MSVDPDAKTEPESDGKADPEADARAETKRPAELVTESAEADIPPEVLNRRICDFDLQIEGSPLARLIERFRAELEAKGLARLRPVFYLSDEWGVPDGTVAIAIPFYLADKQLKRVQRLKGGMVEGDDDEDVLRYMRHEFGHVVNYAHRLYETEEWTRLFGPMARPYVDEYRSVPFSPDFVRNLPGNYAQKHPDDDWAETFAVWMTPGQDWRALYEDAPGALAKLEYCDRTMAALKERDPEVNDTVLDGEVRDIQLTVQEFYAAVDLEGVTVPRSLTGDLRAIFEGYAALASAPDAPRMGSAAGLLRRQRDCLVASVYRWTGVDTVLMYSLLDHLVKLAADLRLTYPMAERDTVLVKMSGFLTTLAMNYVYRGNLFAQ